MTSATKQTIHEAADAVLHRRGTVAQRAIVVRGRRLGQMTIPELVVLRSVLEAELRVDGAMAAEEINLHKRGACGNR